MSNLIESMINENQKFSKDTEKKNKKRVDEAINDNYEVYIIVENGRVQDVFSTTARLNVGVLDFDTTDPDEKEEINQQYEEINQRVASGELKYAW